MSVLKLIRRTTFHFPRFVCVTSPFFSTFYVQCTLASLEALPVRKPASNPTTSVSGLPKLRIKCWIRPTHGS